MDTRRSPRCNLGFSLVEILVTLTIIAVLASLLLGGIVQVRSASRSLVCSNNLRQIGIGYFLYADDNDSAVPQLINTLPGRSYTNWFQPLEDYLGDTPGDRSSRGTIFGGCPEYPIAGNAAWDIGYGANPHLSYPERTTWSGKRHANVFSFTPPTTIWAFSDAGPIDFRLDVIDHASTKLLVADSNCYWASDIWPSESIVARHRGRVNLVYVDGHVGSLPSIADAGAAIAAPR